MKLNNHDQEKKNESRKVKTIFKIK